MKSFAFSPPSSFAGDVVFPGKSLQQDYRYKICHAKKEVGGKRQNGRNKSGNGFISSISASPD